MNGSILNATAMLPEFWPATVAAPRIQSYFVNHSVDLCLYTVLNLTRAVIRASWLFRIVKKQHKNNGHTQRDKQALFVSLCTYVVFALFLQSLC